MDALAEALAEANIEPGAVPASARTGSAMGRSGTRPTASSSEWFRTSS